MVVHPTLREGGKAIPQSFPNDAGQGITTPFHLNQSFLQDNDKNKDKDKPNLI